MFWTAKIKKHILILIGIISLSYILIFLLSPKDITDYTVVDTEYWGNTQNSLLTKTAYDYNNVDDIKLFPKTLGEWNSFDIKYDDSVYKMLNASILLSRVYAKDDGNPVWIDFINSNTGESFHKQSICIKGAGWNIDNESIAEFKIADPPNPFTKLYANRLDASKGDEKQIVIYWFMFKKFGAKDAVTMVRLSLPVDDNETINTTFDRSKSFVEDQLFGAMYKKTSAESITTAEYIVGQYGNKGLFATIMMLLIPIGITIMGIKKKN